MELGEARRMCFAMWKAEENGICGAIRTLLGLPKAGGDRLLRRPGRQRSLGQHWHSWKHRLMNCPIRRLRRPPGERWSVASDLSGTAGMATDPAQGVSGI